MASKATPDGYWTEETISKTAKPYSSIGEFRKNHGSAYIAAYKRYPGLLDKLFVRKKKLNGYWNIKENIVNESLKYDSKIDFMRGNGSAFNSAFKLGILDELFQNIRKPNNYWTKEKILTLSTDFESVTEFKEKYNSAYYAAKRRFPGLLERLFERKNTAPGFWVKENIAEVAKRYKYKKDFTKHHPSVYLTTLKKYPGLIDELFPERCSVQKWDFDSSSKEALKYKSKSEFQFYSPVAYRFLRVSGSLDMFFSNNKKYGTLDSIYLWRSDCGFYKIGVTSLYRGSKRIMKVSKKSGLNCVEILRHTEVKSAKKLEKSILKLGKPVEFDKKFDGSTEFRHLTTDELSQVLAMIDAATIQQEQAA